MDESLIPITRLQQIQARMQDHKDYFTYRAEEAKSLLCTEETILKVKKYRAEMRRYFDSAEEQRKAAIAEVMAPVNEFNAVYKECVADAFKAADAALKAKIDETEGEIKRRCEEGLRDYFDELCAANGLDWLTFERSGVKVDMASAKQKTPKKLREQLKDFVESVDMDCEAIANSQYADEVMTEYKGCLRYSEAVSIVQGRHQRMEQERAALEARTAQKEAEAEVVRKVETVAPPVEVQPPMTVTFTVTDTRERLVALREWMKANNYQYK